MNFADELRRKEQEIQAKEARITALEKQLLPPNENNAELKIDLKNAQLSLSKLEADYKAFRSELLQVQRTQQTPTFGAPLNLFKESLKRCNIDITSIKAKKIIDTIMKRYPYYLIARVGDDEACHELYSEIKELPATFTRGRIQDDLDVSINGPLHGLKSVLSAMDNDTGRRCLIKLLSPPELNVSVTYEKKEEAIKLEVETCETVTNAKIDGLVSSSVVKVRVENSQELSIGTGEWFALKMRHYHSSLTQVPQCSRKLLYRGYLRIKNALIGLHGLNLVHMDVKSDNVFVDEDGIWNLGDFGSARALGTSCWTFTDVLNPYQLIQLKTKVVPSMDFVCLCVMIAVEINKESWKSRLCGDLQKVQRDLIVKSLGAIEDETFREDIVALFTGSYSIVLGTL